MTENTNIMLAYYIDNSAMKLVVTIKNVAREKIFPDHEKIHTHEETSEMTVMILFRTWRMVVLMIK